MLQGVPTVATQAFQLWLTKPVDELGWRGKPDEISGSYVEPLDTYADMSQLLPREAWPANVAPWSIAYFCGAFDDRSGESPDKADLRALESALDYLRNDVQPLWTVAVGPDREFEWSLLVDPDDGEGEQRFNRQYWRANVAGSERYVLTTAGSTANRLAARGSGYANLFLAGDWTLTGLNVGCVEAATMSGLQAASALSTYPSSLSARTTRGCYRRVPDDRALRELRRRGDRATALPMPGHPPLGLHDRGRS